MSSQGPSPVVPATTGTQVSFGDLIPIGAKHSAVKQYIRFMRSRVRFKEPSHGAFEANDAADIVSAFLHAVQDCYHLKDWLKADPWGQTRGGDWWEQVVRKNRYLAAAADLCNASKHAGGTRPPRSAEIIRLEYHNPVGALPDRMSDFYRGLRLHIGEESLHPPTFSTSVRMRGLRHLSFKKLKRQSPG